MGAQNAILFSRLIITILCLSRAMGEEPKIPLHLCDTTKCEGEYKLSIPEEPMSTVEQTKVEAVYYEYPKTAEILYAKRKKLIIKCGANFPPFKSGECDESQILVNPSSNELRKMEDDKTCPTGIECEPDGECYGDTQDKCDSLELTIPNGPKALKWIGDRYQKLIRDTCVSSWECNRHKMNVTLSLNLKGSETSVYFETNDLGKVIVDDKLFDVGFHTLDNGIITLSKRVSNPMPINVVAKCFSGNLHNIKCTIVDENNDITDIPFSLNDKLEAVIRNYHIKILGKIKIIDEGKMKNIFKDSPHSVKVELSSDFNLQKSASLESVIEIIQSIQTLQLQDIYNSETLRMNMQNIFKILRHIVNSLSKIDQKLVSKMSSNLYLTNWITEDIFEKCPCLDVKMENDSNCNGDYFYNQNVYYKRDFSENCVSINKNSLKEINIVEVKDLDVDVLRNLPPQESTRDSEAWVEINRARINKEDATVDDHIHTRGDHRSDYIPDVKFPFGFLSSSMFCNVTCTIFWVYLILNVLIQRRA